MKSFRLISICLLLTLSVFSQSIFKRDTNNTIKNNKRHAWDTLKYRKYERVLIVGWFQQTRNFSNTFEQFLNRDTLAISRHVYTAESKLISGVVLNYDKFSLSFSTKAQPQQLSVGKGNTKMFNIGLCVGDNGWVLENYYRRFIGFYDKNTKRYDTTFKQTGNYYLQPNLKSSTFMSRFMYFTNHKRYSFKSGFGCNYRQLKSSATWILGGSFNVYTLRNDSSIFPIQSRNLFSDYGSLQGFQSVNFSAHAGAAITLVLFKAWFIGGYFTVGPEQQWRSYDLGGNHRNISYVSWSGTTRGSLGINLKRFYLLIAITNDYNRFANKKIISIKSSSTTQNFTFGWRFHAKTPKFYKNFMQTKIYSFI